MLGSLAIMPYNDDAVKLINFTGRNKVVTNSKGDESYKENPIYDKNLKRKGDLGDMSDISFFVRKYVNEQAYKQGISNDAYLRAIIKAPMYTPPVIPVDSKTAVIGNTTVTTLMDGGQIFDKTLEYVKSAKKSIQLEMFEFQNLTVDGDKWPANGAEKVPGGKEQQDLLWMLLKKKKEHPEMKIQIILDAHKWYIDGRGNYKRHYNNADMIRFLKKKGIDVVPYPRASQQGAVLQHVKMLAIDGEKVILGGMNWGSHSAANHDSCVAIETYDKKKGSEVDNIIEQTFNPDWKLSWHQLGKTMLVEGPLSEEEQKYYNGLAKEIKEENVQYMKVVGELYDNDENKNRYVENRLELIPTNPIANPKIDVLGTKPKELEKVGLSGVESTKEYLMERLNNCHTVRGELFVLSDKEVIKTIIKRVKAGELDAKFLIHSEMFPYCRTAYNDLVENGIEVRIYKSDESVNQRLHAKWAVFDNKDILIGSTNWSTQGLTQNLGMGFRDDYDLVEEEMNQEIEKYKEEVKSFEKEIGLEHTSGDYQEVRQKGRQIASAIRKLNKNEDGEEVSIEIGDKKLTFTKEQKSTLSKIRGYYAIMALRHNSKQKYKRGNNELEVAFSSPSLAKNVYLKQFERDWKYSEDEYDKLKNEEMPMILVNKQDADLDLVG